MSEKVWMTTAEARVRIKKNIREWILLAPVLFVAGSLLIAPWLMLAGVKPVEAFLFIPTGYLIWTVQMTIMWVLDWHGITRIRA